MNELSTMRCPHFASCSGCVLSERLNAPPIWTEVQKLFPFPIELETGLMQGWRTKAKLAIRGTSHDPKIGLFLEGSHLVQRIPECHAHHPAINEAVLRLTEAIRAENVSIYNESSGLLRYAQFCVDLATERVQLVLVVQQEDPSLQRLVRRLGTNWHSIWFNVQPDKTNRILGDRWIRVAGERYLTQQLCGQPFLFHPASFAQAHWTLFEGLAAYVVSEIPEGAHLLELYAGIGAMGRLAASRAASVALVENNPFSHQSFLASAQPDNVSYYLEHAADAASRVFDADCILVDPPRKGLDLQILEALARHSGKLIYVSCDYGSLKRNLESLVASGWRLTGGRGYLLFPGTNHVEIVATLEKL